MKGFSFTAEHEVDFSRETWYEWSQHCGIDLDEPNQKSDYDFLPKWVSCYLVFFQNSVLVM